MTRARSQESGRTKISRVQEIESDRRRTALTAGLIFAGALLLRVLYVLHLRGSPLADFPIVDELYHVEWARALAAGNWVGSEVFFRAPLYPYTLGALFSLFGENLFAARMVQALYGALVPVVVYFLGRRAFDERVEEPTMSYEALLEDLKAHGKL